MAESYFGIHLCKLTTFSGTVDGQLRQVLLYLYLKVCSLQLDMSGRACVRLSECHTVCYFRWRSRCTV
jgi:hypothetical protein